MLARLVGHAELLKLVMGSDFKTGYKQIIEASLELCGYYLIWFGTLAALLAARRSAEDSARLEHRDFGSGGVLKTPGNESSLRGILTNRQKRRDGREKWFQCIRKAIPHG